MNMKQLKYVLVLAEEGSFSKAAEILNISQPSLSQYIKKVEKEIGTDLFNRMNGEVRLTSAGEIYVETSKKILDLENQMMKRLIDIAEFKSGTIVIGTTPFRSITMMPYVVAEFKKYYPDINVIIDERGTQELIEAAEKGKFDLCVLPLPVDERKFAYELIMEEEIVVAIASEHALAKKLEMNSVEYVNSKYKVIDVNLLAGEPFVMLTDKQVMQKVLDDLCDEYNLYLNKVAVVKSLEAQIEMVHQGVGAALVPTGIHKFNKDNRDICYFSLKQNTPCRKVAVMYQKGQHLNVVTKRMIDILKQ